MIQYMIKSKAMLSTTRLRQQISEDPLVDLPVLCQEDLKQRLCRHHVITAVRAGHLEGTAVLRGRCLVWPVPNG